jgi:hypothetical protein
VIESVVQELLDAVAFAAESVLGSLPEDFPAEIASSIEAGIRGRLRLLGHREPVSETK